MSIQSLKPWTELVKRHPDCECLLVLAQALAGAGREFGNGQRIG